MKNESSEKTKKTIIGIVLGILVLLVIFLLIKGCTKKEYTVTFDSNGGIIVESVKVKENEKVKKPTDPTKDGYEFGGWYYEDELFDFDTKITKDIILEAYWNAEIGLKVKELNLVIGSTQKLEISSLPDGLSEKDLIYLSSDDSIVTVDENDNLKALKKGTVTITVKSKDGKYSATCRVTVTEEEIEIESVSISGSSSVTVGSSIKLSATFKPDNATMQKLTWKSSDESVATVDENGKVKGLKAGTVTITVTTENGKTATKKITVKEKSTSHNNGGSSSGNTGGNTSGGKTPKPPATVEPTNVTISGNREVYVGDSIQLSATISPSNATNKSVTWKSSNSGIATVDGNGRVTGVSAGTVTITVTTANGKTATYEVTVKEKEPTYVIYITQRKLEVAGGAIQYDFRVERNGTAFTDYLGFEFNGTLVSKGQGSISSTVVKKGGSSAQLTLSNGSKVTAKVIIC